jgi:vacuolar iron transporter family protein
MHLDEPLALGSAQRLNRLRAGVLGANDGIVSVAALVVGVAGATTASATILTAGGRSGRRRNLNGPRGVCIGQ